MSVYRLSRQADSDLEEIAEFIAKSSPSGAVKVLQALHDTFTLLASSPKIGPLREDLRKKLRAFPGRSPAESYLIFYYEINHGIEVVTIIHGSRDYVAMFEQSER